MNVSKIVIHHSASSRDTTKKADIEKWHKERGFRYIGYHKVIEGNGTVKDGRSVSIMGAHAKGANNGSLGVCVVGNFESEIPSSLQVTSLVTILTNWCKTYGLNETQIYGHYNVPGGTTATSCPGKNLKSKIHSIKATVKQNLSRKKYKIESLVKDHSVKRALQKALDGDGRLSYDEIRMIIRSTFDYNNIAHQELADLQVILRNSKSIDPRSRQLIEQFVRNPKSVHL